MIEEIDDEITRSKLSPYGQSTFGTGENLPKPNEEEAQEIESSKVYSPESGELN